MGKTLLFLYDHLKGVHASYPARVLSQGSIETFHDGAEAGSSRKITRPTFDVEYNLGTEEKPVWKPRFGVLRQLDLANWQIKNFIELGEDAGAAGTVVTATTPAAPASPDGPPPTIEEQAIAIVVKSGYSSQQALSVVKEFGADYIVKNPDGAPKKPEGPAKTQDGPPKPPKA